VSPIRDAQGNVIGASKIARDVTEKKRAEKHRELLMAELSHRVKNTLATVLSIERLSLGPGCETDPGRQTFRARILALAHAHTRLAESNWLSARLADLIEDELLPYISAEKKNVTLTGVPVLLSPRCALNVSLAFHELATNAAKYGSLSSPQGRVEVAWHTRPDDGALEIRWNETGGPAVIPPSRIGFGRMLLEQALGQEIGSTVKMGFPSEGVQCSIFIPRSEYEVRFN
jgi:two-component sensor histidine kinase